MLAKPEEIRAMWSVSVRDVVSVEKALPPGSQGGTHLAVEVK